MQCPVVGCGREMVSIKDGLLECEGSPFMSFEYHRYQRQPDRTWKRVWK